MSEERKGELTVMQQTALARVDPQALLMAALERNAGIETMERLAALAREVRADEAREAWYAAMAEFQRRCPTILKTREADTGRYKYRYAPLDEILSKVLPVLGEVGLSLSWRTKQDPGAVVATCRVAHTLGHVEESGELSIPIPAGDPTKGATPPQRVGIARTYAVRYSVLGALGLAPEDDPDAAPLAMRDPEPTVQQPQRKSETKAAHKPPESSGTEQSVQATITDVQTVTGTRKDGKGQFTKYGISASNGETYGTFDEGLADLARTHRDNGEEVTLWYTEKGQYKNLVTITAALDDVPL